MWRPIPKACGANLSGCGAQSLVRLGQTAVVIASAAKLSREQRTPNDFLDRCVASLLAMTTAVRSRRYKRFQMVRSANCDLCSLSRVTPGTRGIGKIMAQWRKTEICSVKEKPSRDVRRGRKTPPFQPVVLGLILYDVGAVRLR